jgi:hypothetical protein
VLYLSLNNNLVIGNNTIQQGDVSMNNRLFVAGNMWAIQRWHAHNCVAHSAEVNRLMDIARQDPGH